MRKRTIYSYSSCGWKGYLSICLRRATTSSFDVDGLWAFFSFNGAYFKLFFCFITILVILYCTVAKLRLGYQPCIFEFLARPTLGSNPGSAPYCWVLMIVYKLQIFMQKWLTDKQAHWAGLYYCLLCLQGWCLIASWKKWILISIKLSVKVKLLQHY